MDPGVRAARDQVARERLLAAAEELAGRHGLDDQLAALRSARSGPEGRDPLLGALFQQEAAADFLEGLVAQSAGPGAPGASGGRPSPKAEVTAPERAPAKAPDKAPEPEKAPEPAKAVPRRGYPAVPEKAPDKAPDAGRSGSGGAKR